MKNFYFTLLACLLFIMTGCTKQVGTQGVQAELSSKVTGYEQGLKDYASSITEFSSQSQDIQAMDPSILFSFSHSLLVKGDYDQAVFWYYLAQLRAIVLYNSVDEDLVVSNEYFSKVYTESGLAGMPYIIGSVSKQMLYRAIMQTFGRAITQIGIKDTKRTAELICAALNYEAQKPFKVAKAAAGIPTKNVMQISAAKKRVRNALLDFVKDLREGDISKKQYLK